MMGTPGLLQPTPKAPLLRFKGISETPKPLVVVPTVNASPFDALGYLEEFLHGIEDASQDILFNLSEVRERDIDYYELRDRIVESHKTLQTHEQSHGPSTSHPNEDLVLDGIRQDYAKLSAVTEDKQKLVSSIGSKTMGQKVDAQLKKLDADLAQRGIDPAQIPASKKFSLNSAATEEALDALLEEEPILQSQFRVPPVTAVQSTRKLPKMNLIFSSSALMTPSGSSGQGRKRRRTTTGNSAITTGAVQSQLMFMTPAMPKSSVVDLSSTKEEEKETVYCVCRQVSFGDMVGCDSADCPIEWFHYACVGLKEPPKGSWFCSACLAKSKKPISQR